MTVGTASFADINFDGGNVNDPVYSNISASLVAGTLYTLTTNGLTTACVNGSGSAPDLNNVRTFMPVNGGGRGATNFVTWFPGFTRYSGAEAVFVVSASNANMASFTGSNAGAATSSIVLSLQPRDTSRGDFEDNLGRSTSTDTGLNKDIGIPEVNLELRSEPIVASWHKTLTPTTQ
jgi:hypothetical protein